MERTGEGDGAEASAWMTDLYAAIGRMVVNAAELEYAVAEIVAVTEGRRGEACQERATGSAS